MKQGTLVSRIVMLSLLVAILIYLGVYVWQAMTNPYTLVLSYNYTVDDQMEATGFLAREEQVIPGPGGIVDPLLSEGEKVAAGGTVAVSYQNELAVQRRQQIRALELELEQLQYAQSNSTAAGGLQSNREILDNIAALRISVTAGDLTRLEDETMALKGLIYKREAAFREQAGSTETISAAITAVEGQISALRTQAAQDTRQITAAQPGIFSGQVDGYESLLQPDGLEEMTPSDLDRLAAQAPAGDATAAGKLITDSTWYFITTLSEEDASRLYEGGEVQVRFSRDWAGEVPMKVERISAPEVGRVAVLLSSNRFLSDTTLLRRQTVDIIFRSQTGIRVPKAAIRVDNVTEEDPDSGAEITRQTVGVYALVSGRAEFKPVSVLDEREDFCIVEPLEMNTRKALRAGDEIILAAVDLFDGKVIE